jgi:hypothetical protein
MSHQEELQIEETEVQLLLAENVPEGEIVQREEKEKNQKQPQHPKTDIIF